MAVAPVTLGPSLRAWSLTGLTHILCHGPVDPVYLGGEASPAAPAACAPASVRTLGGAERVFSPHSGPAPRAHKNSLSQEPPAAPHMEPPRVPLAFAFADRSGTPADPAEWPEAWSAWFGRIRPAPILWTYHELGADLTGKSNAPERSDFFRTLIKDLALRKGSSVFWPSAMPADSSTGQIDVLTDSNSPLLQANPAIFSAGITRLNPQLLIVFGEKALEDMGLAGRLRPLRQEMVEGKQLLCLPEIALLLHNPGQRTSALSLLRGVLAQIRLP